MISDPLDANAWGERQGSSGRVARVQGQAADAIRVRLVDEIQTVERRLGDSGFSAGYKPPDVASQKTGSQERAVRANMGDQPRGDGVRSTYDRVDARDEEGR